MTVHGYYFAAGGEWDVIVLAEEQSGSAQSVAALFSTESMGMYSSTRPLWPHSADAVEAAIVDATHVRPWHLTARRRRGQPSLGSRRLGSPDVANVGDPRLKQTRVAAPGAIPATDQPGLIL